MMPDRRTIVAGLLAAAAFPAASQGARLRKSISTIVPFKTSPFPYRGKLPDGSGPFLDVTGNGRHGHTSPRGGIYWEDETYSDRSTLLPVPKGFDPAKPAVIVVFFHGNGATLQRDVVARQRVVAQVEASVLNAVLVAPQFASNAQDSSAGNFWTPAVCVRGRGSAGPGQIDWRGGRLRAMPGWCSSIAAATIRLRAQEQRHRRPRSASSCSTPCLTRPTFSPVGSQATGRTSSSAPLANLPPPAMRKSDNCWQARASTPARILHAASKPAPSPSLPRMPPTIRSSLGRSSTTRCSGCLASCTVFRVS